MDLRVKSIWHRVLAKIASFLALSSFFYIPHGDGVIGLHLLMSFWITFVIRIIALMKRLCKGLITIRTAYRPAHTGIITIFTQCSADCRLSNNSWPGKWIFAWTLELEEKNLNCPGFSVSWNWLWKLPSGKRPPRRSTCLHPAEVLNRRKLIHWMVLDRFLLLVINWIALTRRSSKVAVSFQSRLLPNPKYHLSDRQNNWAEL